MPIEHESNRVADGEREAELLRHTADVVIELSLDGRITFISDSVERVLARPASSFVGLSFLEVIVPEDREAALAEFQKVVATGTEPLVRFRVPRRDGLRVEFETAVRSFDGEDGRRIVAVARDVTQRSAESAVSRRRDQYYRALIESNRRPAGIMTRAGHIVFSNRAFRERYGRDVRASDGMTRVPDALHSVIATAWYESTRSGASGSGTCDFCYEDDEGNTPWYSASWQAFQGEDDQRLYALFLDDITARKKVEIALRSIAQGIMHGGLETMQANLELIAEALELDRLVAARVHREEAGMMTIIGGCENGRPLTLGPTPLFGLPDASVARGEDVIYPSGAARLVPSIAEHLSAEYEGYVGIPLKRADGEILGLIGGYARHPIIDADLARSLLATFATQAVAQLDRQDADEEIRAGQDRFDVLASQAHEILIEICANGEIVYASDSAHAILGYSPAEMVGMRIPELIHPEDRPSNRTAQASLFLENGHSFVVNRIRHADGRWRWVESRSSSFAAPDGSRRALILARDVSDQHHHELGRELLYRVVQEGTDLIFVCEPDTTLLFANEAASRRVQHFDEEVGDGGDGAACDSTDADRVAGAQNGVQAEGRRLVDLLSEDEARRLEEEILPGLTPGRPWSGELSLLGPHGQEAIPTEARVFLFLGSEDSDRTYLGVSLRDIEARRQAEEALRESELRLNQAQKMEAVGRLAGGIAHDFNNLLTAIIGYSDLVLDEIGQDHVAHHDAEEILRAAERAGGLTRQLLAFSRRQVLQPEPIDLNTVVANIDRMMRRLIGENIELVTSQSGVLLPVIADAGQIEQVIVNLVVNARDAMPQGGRIEIETANFRNDTLRRTESGVLAPGDYVVLSVRDNGIGIDDATRAQIFEPFFTTKEVHRGTGLGLSTVYGIVSQSGGQIDVSSSEGVGTTFKIYIPATEQRETEEAPTTRQDEKKGRETILVVEDAAPVRRLLERTLTGAGYTALTADNATSALRHCSRHQGEIDLMLVDVVLPKASGPEIVGRALEIRPGTPVLFMSGFTDDTLDRFGLDPAHCELIEKPFTPSTVLARVRALLDARSASTS